MRAHPFVAALLLAGALTPCAPAALEGAVPPVAATATDSAVRRPSAPRPAGDVLRRVPASERDSTVRPLRTVLGEATFYAAFFEGRLTASGKRFSNGEMTAAHRKYPFGTRLRVTNMRNRRSVEVVVTDRGPFGERAAKRNTIIDLSRRAAEELGYVRRGRTPVRIEVLEWGNGRG